MSGQDTSRGTFSQRHAVLHDVKTASATSARQHPRTQEQFHVLDSMLSENAVLGFEFG